MITLTIVTSSLPPAHQAHHLVSHPGITLVRPVWNNQCNDRSGNIHWNKTYFVFETNKRSARMIFSAKKLFQNWFFFVNKGYHKPLLKIYITQKVRAIVDSGKVLLSYVFWRSNKFWFAQQLCLGLEQSFNNNLLALSRYNFHIRLPVLGGPSKKMS